MYHQQKYTIQSVLLISDMLISMQKVINLFMHIPIHLFWDNVVKHVEFN